MQDTTIKVNFQLGNLLHILQKQIVTEHPNQDVGVSSIDLGIICLRIATKNWAKVVTLIKSIAYLVNMCDKENKL